MTESSNIFEKICYQDKIIAIVFNASSINKTEFISNSHEYFQLGFGFIDSDKSLEAHIHRKVERNIDQTSEFIFVVEGEMEINILSPQGEDVFFVKLYPGFGLLQYFGGHKIFIKSGTKYFEIKQGPYMGQEFDKNILKDGQ